ncbi:MAG: lipo-like protein, partial [Afipia sp.]|nr:lipo-like protein [Afipia sp.]
ALGFDYTSLHWADTTKPSPEVTGEDDPFPDEIFDAPGLIPETADSETEAPLAWNEDEKVSRRDFERAA